MLRDLFSLFPAHAGVILVYTQIVADNLTFPRTCGGDPLYVSKFAQFRTFSPHMRG